MGRLLSPYEYGILNLTLPLQFMVIVLTSAGIAPSVAKFISEGKVKKDDINKITSSAALYYSLGGVFVGLTVFVIAPIIGSFIFRDLNVVLPLRIASLAIPFGILISVYTGIFQGLKRIGYMSGVLLVEQMMRVVLAVFLVTAGFGVVGAISGSTLGFLSAVPLSYLLYKRLGLSFRDYDFGIFKEIFYFSIPTSITALSSFLLAYADILLIGVYMLPTDVGIYSAASPASRLMLAFTMALYAVIIPSVSELSANGSIKAIKHYFKISLLGIGLFIVPATLTSFIFSTQILTLLFTDVYIEAVPSFQILIVGVAFLSLFMTNSAIFQGMGKPSAPMKVLLIFTFLDILLNIALIPRYGIEGAAFSTALAGVGAGVVSTILLAKYLNTIEEKATS
jgi:O-antigen/teichoic acid export membrane protein